MKVGLFIVSEREGLALGVPVLKETEAEALAYIEQCIAADVVNACSEELDADGVDFEDSAEVVEWGIKRGVCSKECYYGGEEEHEFKVSELRVNFSLSAV